ncbi:MAG: glutamate carboxypeptidase, partial [Solirubrobacteraceae bacterium]|nr:glutamate carboxypeptidase [Solirubrobacteraceae bacterium]
PTEATVERVASSSTGHADDFVGRLAGDGARRLLLLGHLDTVVAHPAHRPLTREDDRLVGSGAVDMKGGVALALGIMQALAGARDAFAEVALLLVCDEEWRLGGFAHVERFTGFDACLCFEAGQLGPGGEEAVVVRRKAAGTLEVRAHGASAHSGSAPDQGRNALLALAAAAQQVAACHDPKGQDRLTAVPTVIRSGGVFNAVPADGELVCDVRADRADAFQRVIDAVPVEVGGATLETRLLRCWPGMDSREATTEVLARASSVLGRPILAGGRGGASDASHFAPAIPLTIDGLGPRGGGAHTPDEYVLAPALPVRAQVALAIVAALLDE